MEQVDRLEKLQIERDRKRLIIHAAASDRLLNSPDKNSFNDAWNFIQNNFNELYSVKENISELRKAILQLAVMGKLVPQAPNDPPASELLKEIEAEKKRLIKEGNIKKQKPLPEIKLEEIPYQIPDNWKWTNLQELFAVVTDGDHQAPPKTNKGIPFLVIGNLNSGNVTFENCRFVPESYYEALDWSRKPKKGDILYTVTGSYGIPIYIDGNQQFCVQRQVAILKSVTFSPIEYLKHYLMSQSAFQYATNIATGIAQKTVPLTGLRKMPVSLPPLPEQHRIVAKVDRLMALCDQLEAQLTKQTEKQTALLNEVIAAI
ncbi:similar to type I site-specific deoxyribonuclease [Stanieria sp. NIES-3757]|nr:similar to type I site-specific deoxyribonuclease [Stanieria sp. NIES-3757]